MRTKPRAVVAVPAEPVLQQKSYGTVLMTAFGMSDSFARFQSTPQKNEDSNMSALTTWLIRRRMTAHRERCANCCAAEPNERSEEYVRTPRKMAQINGNPRDQRESTPVDMSVVPPGRVISTSMMRQGISTGQMDGQI